MRGRSCWANTSAAMNGFELGASNPALYRSELVNGFCHGDDFVTAAAEDLIESFGKLLQEKFDTRRIWQHLDKELEVLHRSVKVFNNELMEIEADQKHVSQIAGRSWTHSRQLCQDSKSEIECNRGRIN